MDNTMYIQI